MAFKISEIKVVIGEATSQKGIMGSSLFSGQEATKVIVQSREEETNGLASILEQEGVQTIRQIGNSWVRDQYIYRNSLFFPVSNCGNWAVGGSMLFADDYMVVPVTLPGAVKKTKEETKNKLCESYNVSRVHFIPTHGNRDHIDPYLLLLPSINVVVSDSEYYNNNSRAIDELARAEGLHSLQVSNPQVTISSGRIKLQANTYPTNSIDLLDESGSLLVFTAKPDCESPLVKALEDYDAKENHY